MTDTNYTFALIIIEIIFSIMLLRTLSRAGMTRPQVSILGGVLMAWLFLIYSLLTNGFFSSTGIPQLSFTLGVVVPVMLGLIAVKFYQPLASAFNNIPSTDFLALQATRVIFGVVFFFTTALPSWFQYVGGLGDIAAGVGALLALAYLKKHPDKERQAIIKGNFIGILDFIIVLNLGALIVLIDHSPDIIFNLIPLYVVPIYILLHIFSLMKLGTMGNKGAN